MCIHVHYKKPLEQGLSLSIVIVAVYLMKNKKQSEVQASKSNPFIRGQTLNNRSCFKDIIRHERRKSLKPVSFMLVNAVAQCAIN